MTVTAILKGGPADGKTYALRELYPIVETFQTVPAWSGPAGRVKHTYTLQMGLVGPQVDQWRYVYCLTDTEPDNPAHGA